MIFGALAKVMGFAKGSTHPVRRVAVIVLLCVTAPCERAYAMNDRPDSSQPKFVQDVVAHWWWPTAPDGEEFELPSGTKTCSRLKVRFVGEIIWVLARVGPGYPYEASFLVEDNLGDQQYSAGKVIKAFFYVRYNDVHFGHSEINQKLGRNDFWFQDRNDANLVLNLLPGHDQPETPVAYVCAFKEGDRTLLSYFLKRSPQLPWSPPGHW
ncbi:hypothetical protein AAFG07_17230 [Bradyrhizobium sp. B097]|uniref:hypothetical protein n=1 Tax=Bradyrhizobium sp. B097 TaxID=3140244 RepID=UPI003183C48E